MKDVRTYLINCSVPEAEIDAAVESIQIAKNLSKGLLWHKIVARFFKSSKMAKIVVSNKVKRVSDFDQNYIAYDVARCKNINAFLVQ